FVKYHLKRAKQANYLKRNRLLLGTVPPYSVDFEAGNDGGAENAAEQLNFHEAVSCTRYAVDFLGSCDDLVCIIDENEYMVIWNPCIGHDTSSDDYKMVIGTSFSANGSTETTIEVLALKTNTWRRIQDTNYANIKIGYHKGIFWNGALHWTGKLRKSPNEVNAIISFDMAEEKFDTLPVPAEFQYMVFRDIRKQSVYIQ
ncbi:hypothetical protein Tsubulata_041208, partial [Turnera subulata]